MGHWNIQMAGHVTDLDPGQQGHIPLHPDPCIFYGSAVNFPQHNMHSLVTAPGNLCNFGYHPMPECIDSASFYGTPPYSVVPPQLELAVAASSAHYNPCTTPLSDGCFPNIFYIGVQSFKRKSSEQAPVNYQFQSASPGRSSSAAPMAARPVEPVISQMDATSFLPPEYGRNDPSSAVGSESRIVRNMTSFIVPESTRAHSTSHFIQGNYIVPPVQLPGNPWLDMHLGANVDIGTFTQSQALNSHYVHGVPGNQVMDIRRSAAGGFLCPPVMHFHSNSYHPIQPTQGVRGYSTTSTSYVPTSSRRMPLINSSPSGITTFQDAVASGPTFLAHIPPANFRSHWPHRSEIILDPNARQHIFPHLRVLPEDEVAVLEIPSYDEAGDSFDQHMDLRLDIDHMSYEELLALGEYIGSVGTGLMEDFIRNNLKTRTFTLPPTCVNRGQAAFPDQSKMHFCVICQADYECKEAIGRLDCGHEYHGECIKRWLLVKNTCPVCKSTALTGSKGMDL